MSMPIVRAFGISVALHIAAFFIVEVGNKAGLWKASVLPKSALNKGAQLVDPKQLQKNNETPVLTFVEVDPSQATEEPKNTPLYSTANTKAGNPTVGNAEIPKIDGPQDKVLKTTTVSKSESVPAPPPQQPQRETMQPATKQVAAEPVGDTKQNTLTPEEKAKQDMTFDKPTTAQKPTQPRPRTLADARAQKGIIEGPKMKQDGGVSRFNLETTMDVKNSPFGSYDAQFIAAVQTRWDQLLANRVVNQSGKVIIEFRLYSDGRILQLNVRESEVSQTLAAACQQAILDPSPYARFPADLKRVLGRDYRDIKFTFHYGY